MKKIRFFTQINHHSSVRSTDNSSLKLTDLTMDALDYMFANNFIEFTHLQSLRIVNKKMKQIVDSIPLKYIVFHETRLEPTKLKNDLGTYHTEKANIFLRKQLVTDLEENDSKLKSNYHRSSYLNSNAACTGLCSVFCCIGSVVGSFFIPVPAVFCDCAGFGRSVGLGTAGMMVGGGVGHLLDKTYDKLHTFFNEREQKAINNERKYLLEKKAEIGTSNELQLKNPTSLLMKR